jgi:hypothetical protein
MARLTLISIANLNGRVHIGDESGEIRREGPSLLTEEGTRFDCKGYCPQESAKPTGVQTSDDTNRDAGPQAISLEVLNQTTNDRRSKNFEFFWQAVALSLAVQAFLMTIALGGGTSNLGQYLAASLSIMVSLAAVSLMLSQRTYQRIEERWLDLFEHAPKGDFVLGHGAGP